MPSITVKNIPDDLYERLRRAARANRRSINSEILICLERHLLSHPLDPDAFLAKARLLREKSARFPLDDGAFDQAKRAGRP